MTLGDLSAAPRSPRFSSSAMPCLLSHNALNTLISESFLTVKGAALFLPRGNGSSTSSTCSSRATGQRSKHAGDLQQHLQTMFTLLRPEDNIRLAVRLESVHPQSTRYMVVVSTNGRQDTEESVVLGMDFSHTDSSCTIGLVLPLWSDTLIHLDGDGGFSVSTDNRVHVFKPVSVQAMWSALQSLHKACEVARCHNYFPGSLFLTWVSYYQSRVSSDQTHINEWNAMQDVQSHRADSPVLFSDVPTERERTERLIKTRLREIMMQKDLENVTSKEIRTELEMHMVCNLREFKEYIDNEMIVILGQMDSPTEIFEHVYLGSEWNASNLEELQNSGVQYILNVTREIDNFFPGLFEYHNIRVYDEEATDLLAYWNDTYKFISRAKKAGAKCLVHCKMGVSRSASTVIAYAMKEYGWDLERAFEYVKERRAVTKPNPSFMRQLEEYQGILLASKQRHNKLWRSHSDSDLSEHHEPLVKAPVAQTLGRSNPRNQSSSLASPSLHALLQTLTPASIIATGVEDQEESGEQEVPFSNGLGDSEESVAAEDPPMLPRPRAATVVPEVQPDVAETISLGRCHPPASLHNLVSYPRILSDAETKSVSCEQSETPSVMPEENCGPQVSKTESNRSKTPEPSKRAPDSSSAGLPTQVPEHHRQELSQQVPDTDSDCAGLFHTSDDDYHHPSATLSEAGLSTLLPSTLSTDRIDFFSAREKFLGLAQEGQTRGSSEQAVQQMPQDKSHSHLLLPEDHIKGEEDQQKESCNASVNDVVSELDSVRHSVTPPPSLISQPISSSYKEEEEEEQEELVKSTQEEAEMQKAELGEALQTDWPKGTVRRATRQLEQKLKQEVSSSTLLTCAHGGSSLRSAVCTSSRDRTVDTSPHTDLTQDPSTVSAHHHQPESTVEEKVEKEASPIEEGMEKGGEIRLREEECGHTGNSDEDISLVHSMQNHSTQSSSSPAVVLQLDGVVEKESSTDSPSDPHMLVDMRETWETLKELGAFLCQVSGRSDKRPSHPWAGKEQRKGRSIQERAKEVEARIRQAGLTPPSLIKRSASLAKLGSLELSTSDLSELELSAASVSRPTLKPRPHSFTDDTSKKKRVLPRRTPSLPSSDTSYLSSTGSCTDKTLEGQQTGELEHSDSNDSPTSLPLSNQCWRQGKVQDSTPVPAPALTSVVTRQQYGRTHPLRRLKKRTLNPYHTM
ncbi:protein phosphatase Slingshot homolog 2b isoform X2 [Hoplias malabaricus]|uniref:protein phosphatase Slingshot homolog 2b isoform X2 n=1 Tax=Hoplias malabaricus TaxID=27720 RepID=UPI003462A235